MTSTTENPTRYASTRLTIPVLFQITADTDSDLGRQVFEHLRDNPHEIPAWLDASLALAYDLANARSDDAAPSVRIEARLDVDWAETSGQED